MATEPEIPEDWKANYNLATAIVNSHCEEDHWPMLLVRAIREIASLKHALSDPAAVHINILRGTIPLSRANAIHIAGLPADVDKQLAENAALRATKAEWLKQNGPGGWIDELRATVERLNQEMAEAIDTSTQD